uniref:Uncharacterized protein n=1 Tax=Chromera velia CCMP2878 TaxID=1169474 RepID=A0A0G4FMB8_9ALVE|eukprot:Cvel_17571.t1-p1 / transcript=Cvel_17571.t1 / gene=Cvel_17571 / organism=Chromera_velia_CCMP2878 / gene_product=hypothetical protein / transcript_product=hypothetical protein / location=Cvel_scaffold1411:45378-45653(-) / protein_length=92 / sequence_SO=supercontig / SO=protein_coding / is_pseudo=false
MPLTHSSRQSEPLPTDEHAPFLTRLSAPLSLPAPVPPGPAPAPAVAVGPQEGKVVTGEFTVTSLVSPVITVAAVVLFQALFGTVAPGDLCSQ